MIQRISDEFESPAASRDLVDELRRRIEADGPITFRDFMEAALYHPRLGYYTTHPDAMTARGDFLTSPETHPVFGALVAKQLWQMWDMMGRPARFDVVEAGAGTGALARDIMDWALRREPDFRAVLRYRIVERIETLRREQARTLERCGGQFEWLEALPRGTSGAVVTNEVLDAFPVHRVVREGRTLREVYVSYEDGRFADQLRPLSDEALARCFDDTGVLPGEGCLAEVNLDAMGWMGDVARSMRRGYVLTFDYGYEASELYAPWRRDGTFLCFYRHSAGSDPYQRVGRQDMTSSVDFTTLRRAGERAGLWTAGFTDQASFLRRLGIHLGIAPAAGDIEEYFSRRRAVLDLIDPARLGRIRVLAQGKDAPAAGLWGFSGGD